MGFKIKRKKDGTYISIMNTDNWTETPVIYNTRAQAKGAIRNLRLSRTLFKIIEMKGNNE